MSTNLIQDALGMNLRIGTVFHLTTNSQTEHSIQILENMLHVCELDFGGSWEDRLDLIEFSYNNHYHVSIQMAPFEALYGRRCRSSLCCDDAAKAMVFGPPLI